MKEMIYLENVCLDFGKSFSLDRLSFQVMPGEVFGFLGPSGAGKTTTMKLLTKQLNKKSGQIRIMGRDIESAKREDYDRIGILTDTNGLYERMTIEDNLKFFAELRQLDRGKVEEILKKVCLYKERKTKIKKCSKGMRQRALLAVAVLHEPELLFLDEPTNGLDPATIQEVHKLLIEMNRNGTTIFLTTHNMQEADKLCGRIGILDEGKVIITGTPEELKLRYAKNEIQIMTKDRKKILFEKSPENAEKIATLLRQGDLLTVHSKEPNLEEIFLQLTGREF